MCYFSFIRSRDNFRLYSNVKKIFSYVDQTKVCPTKFDRHRFNWFSEHFSVLWLWRFLAENFVPWNFASHLAWNSSSIYFTKNDNIFREYKKDYRGVYSSRSHNNDIMMFVFESAFDYTDYVRPAALPIDASFKAPPGSKCIISGWGNTETGSKIYFFS